MNSMNLWLHINGIPVCPYSKHTKITRYSYQFPVSNLTLTYPFCISRLSFLQSQEHLIFITLYIYIYLYMYIYLHLNISTLKKKSQKTLDFRCEVMVFDLLLPIMKCNTGVKKWKRRVERLQGSNKWQALQQSTQKVSLNVSKEFSSLQLRLKCCT